MKLHLITIGRPKLAYAQLGFAEYIKRLGRFHTVTVTHLADKYANDSAAIVRAAGAARIVALVIDGNAHFSSPQLADYMQAAAGQGIPLAFIIGGPEGLPQAVIDQAGLRWSFSDLTLPHDLAMVVLAEALYRASTIAAGHPYHRG